MHQRLIGELPNPVGLAMLAVSAGVAALVALSPPLAAWSGRAQLILAWGVVALVARAALAAAAPPHPRSPGPTRTAPTPGTASRRRGRFPLPDGQWLTPAEVDVLCLLTSGLSNKEIAARRVTTVTATERQIFSIYEKIGLHKRVEAARWAMARGLCDPDQFPPEAEPT